MSVALLVCLLTLGLALAFVILGSKWINMSIPAVVGAAVVVTLGYVSWPTVGYLWDLTWDATLTLVGLLLIAHLLEQAGFFAFLANHIARVAGGRLAPLWLGLMALTIAVTAVLANDGAVLIMTPLVAELVLTLQLPRKTMLAFLLATGFLVDAASTPLITSNLTNIIVADAFHLSFLDYARVHFPGWLAVVVTSLGLLWLLFRRQLQGTFDLAAMPESASCVRHPAVFRAGGWVLGGLMVANLANGWLHWPTAVWTGLGACTLAVIALRSNAVAWRTLVWTPPWHLVLFAQGMFIMVQGVAGHGGIEFLGRCWAGLGHSALAIAYGVGLTETLLSAATNNLPALLIGVLTLTGWHDSPERTLALAAAIVGANVGSKLTPIGSLATLIWLHMLDQKGIRIGWGEYLAFAVVVTLPVTASALAVLAWWLH